MRIVSGRPSLSVLFAALLAIAALAAGACAPVDDTGGTGGTEQSATGAAPRPNSVDSAAAQRQLGGLKVAAPRSMSGYTRERFPHWRSAGGGCDTRDAVLKRDGTDLKISSDCRISSGRWYSWYDGRTYTDPQQIDIDHMVALANAWRSGANAWTDDKRADFANDMARPQLLAVSASQNRAKGDQDPSQWKPANRAYWCEYAARWIAVKAHYGLTVTQAEKGALGDMLGTCR